MDKPFWRSRKFGYAVGTLLAALLLRLLASVDGISPDVRAALTDFIPTVIVMGVLLITGHTVTDVIALWKEGVQAVNLRDAVLEVIEVLLDAMEDTGAPEDAPVSDDGNT